MKKIYRNRLPKDTEAWRNNCINCKFFDDCQSSKSAEDCTAFLEKEMKEQIKRLLKAGN